MEPRNHLFKQLPEAWDAVVHSCTWRSQNWSNPQQAPSSLQLMQERVVLSLRMEGREEPVGSGGGGGKPAAGSRPRALPAPGTHRPGLLSPAWPWRGPGDVTVLGRSRLRWNCGAPRQAGTGVQARLGQAGEPGSLQRPGAWRGNSEAMAQSLLQFV